MSSSFDLFLVAGDVVHEVEHEFFKDHAQAACADLAVEGFAGDFAGGVVGPGDLDAFVVEEFGVLLEDRVARAW